MFIDEVVVDLKAGDGGHGCMSFRREKYIPKGGPNGGDGGKGGNVVIVCDHNMGDLTPYKFVNHGTAQNGQPGMGNEKHGADGKDFELKVPPGTIIIDTQTKRPVFEVTEHDQKVVLLKGGEGGLGNVHFKSSTNQTPRQFTEGKSGEFGSYLLELKTIADVGLVGFPNAGKSTLVNALTDAKRKTAAYPFTTLNPSVGVIHYNDNLDRVLLADIPGLIKGANENRGLGHRFLRHIERCNTLIFIIDMAAYDGRDPAEDYTDLVEELRLYNPKLLEKKFLVVANKMDEDVAQENLKEFRKKHDVEVVPISAVLEEGLDDLRQKIWDYTH